VNSAVITGLVRHVLTFGGGYLVAKGVLDNEAMNDAVGAVVTLVGIAWSAFAKKPKTT
jgi:hypothetical protein